LIAALGAQVQRVDHCLAVAPVKRRLFHVAARDSTDGKKILYTADPNVGPWSLWSTNSDSTGAAALIIDGSKKYQAQLRRLAL